MNKNISNNDSTEDKQNNNSSNKKLIINKEFLIYCILGIVLFGVVFLIGYAIRKTYILVKKDKVIMI